MLLLVLSTVCAVIVVILIALLLTKLCLKLLIGRCTSQASMVGKVIIVTGANAGIGFQTAKDLANRGGRVILACRNEVRGLAARERIISETGNSDVVFKQLNLSSLASVRKFAEDVLKAENRLDVLINNAGMHGGEDRYTEDGILEGMQVNYLAPFLLTNLLLPILKKSQSSRIVNVTSVMIYAGAVNLEKLNKKDSYYPITFYTTSKLCMTIFTNELARRLEGTGVVANSVHPGIVRTSIVKEEHNVFDRTLYKIFCWLCSRTVEEGAASTIHVAVSEQCGGLSGKYFSDCKQRFMPLQARSKTLAKNLWELSEKLVNLV